MYHTNYFSSYYQAKLKADQYASISQIVQSFSLFYLVFVTARNVEGFCEVLNMIKDSERNTSWRDLCIAVNIKPHLSFNLTSICLLISQKDTPNLCSTNLE